MPHQALSSHPSLSLACLLLDARPPSLPSTRADDRVVENLEMVVVVLEERGVDPKHSVILNRQGGAAPRGSLPAKLKNACCSAHTHPAAAQGDTQQGNTATQEQKQPSPFLVRVRGGLQSSPASRSAGACNIAESDQIIRGMQRANTSAEQPRSLRLCHLSHFQ